MNERGHLSSETIDLMMLASLAAPERERAQAHLGQCDTCRGLVNEVEQDFARFQQYVLPKTLPQIEARAARGLRPRWLRGLSLSGLGLVAALGVAVVLWPQLKTPTDLEAPYLGTKGLGAKLQVVANREGTQFRVGAGSHLRPGDRLRFVVDAGPSRYVLIASRVLLVGPVLLRALQKRRPI